MGVDFYPAIIDNPGTANEHSRPAIRCACDLLVPTYEAANEHGRVCPACEAKLNIANENACDLLAYLGILDAIADGSHGIRVSGTTSAGHIQADLLARLCRARLNMVNAEPERPAIQLGRVIISGREASYLPARARSLLAIAMLARGGWVVWS